MRIHTNSFVRVESANYYQKETCKKVLQVTPLRLNRYPVKWLGQNRTYNLDV